MTVTSYALKPLWSDPSWLVWEYHIESGTYLSKDRAERPYEFHQHACDRLVDDPNDFDRVDAITTLRRAISQRVRMLKEIYELRKLLIPSKPKGDLELLTYLEIIRPFMLRRLIDIRDIVEHQDSVPPSVDECLMFADLVWYFLRSTDALVHSKVSAILFEPPGATDESSEEFHPSTELIFDNLSEPPEIRIWLNPASFIYEPKPNWIRIEPTKVDGYKKEGEKEDSRFWIAGKMRGTEQQMSRVYRLYFRSSYFS